MSAMATAQALSMALRKHRIFKIYVLARWAASLQSSSAPIKLYLAEGFLVQVPPSSVVGHCPYLHRCEI